MKQDWEPWNLSPYCWCLNATHASALDKTRASTQKSYSAPTPKDLSLDRAGELSPCVMAKPSLSPDMMSFSCHLDLEASIWWVSLACSKDTPQDRAS